MGARRGRKQQPGLPGVQAEDLCADAWMLQALAHHIAQGLPTVVPVDYDDLGYTGGQAGQKLFQLPLGVCGCEAVQIDFHSGFAGILKHVIASLCEIFSQKDSLLDFIVGYMLK